MSPRARSRLDTADLAHAVGTDGAWDDAQIPLCVALASGAGVDEWLAPRLDCVTSIRVVAHRPGRRIVLRLEGERSGNTVSVFVKGLRAASWTRAMRVYAGVRAAGLDDVVVTPCGASESLRALVFDGIEGECLHRAGCAGTPLDAAPIGALLRRFACAVPAGAAWLPSRDLEDERRSALTMLGRGTAFVPELGSLAERVLDWDLPSLGAPRGFVHGDLHDKQIFVHGPSVIDVDGAAWGSPWVDRANLVEHIRLRVLQGAWSRPWAARLQRALAFSSVPPEYLAARRLSRARLAGVYAQRPAYADLARALATSIERIDRSPS